MYSHRKVISHDGRIDRDDIDKVLRVECDQLQPEAVIKIVA